MILLLSHLPIDGEQLERIGAQYHDETQAHTGAQCSAKMAIRVYDISKCHRFPFAMTCNWGVDG